MEQQFTLGSVPLFRLTTPMQLIPLSFRFIPNTAIRLAQSQLRQSKSFRFAQVLSLLSSLAFCSAMIFLALQHQRATVMHVVPRAVSALAWICGILVGWTGASNQQAKDLASGVVDLAKSHGIPAAGLHLARGFVATIQTAKLVFFSSLPLVILAACLAQSPRQAALRLGAVLPVVLYSVATGILAGALSYTCAWLSPTRGKSLFFSIVLLPWWFQGLLMPNGKHTASLPALLGYLADLVTAFGGAS